MWYVLIAAAALIGFVVGLVAARSRRVAVAIGDPPGEPVPPGPSVEEVVADHPVGVVLAGADGHVVYRNRVAASLQGTHVGVIVAKAVDGLLAEAIGGRGCEQVVELYGPPKVVVEVVGRPLPSGGAVAFIVDTTEQRRVEQVRTDFVANISHELKTPIGALSALAETLVDEPDGEVVRRIVDRMIGEAQRASRTVDDLMELSSIEIGGGLEIDRVRAVDVAREAVDRVAAHAVQRNIRVTVVASERVAQTVDIDTDRRRLVSALVNIVENAIKYSPPDSDVKVAVARTDDQPIRTVTISVSDQGVGIPQRDLDRIFERFYRVDRARSRATGGTGLGLAIVRNTMHALGGSVEVTSVEGEGSTFTVSLPEASTGRQRPARSTSSAPDARPGHDRGDPARPPRVQPEGVT